MSGSGSDSDKEVPQHWDAYPQDRQRILNLPDELESVKEPAKN